MTRDFTVLTGADLVKPVPKPKDGTKWGKWVYHADNLTLEYQGERGAWYEVDLERCNDSGEILDWLVQVLHKNWSTRADVGDLLRALDDLAGQLQSKVCAMGKNQRFSYARHLSEKGEEK
jgi:hypothetical protein